MCVCLCVVNVFSWLKFRLPDAPSSVSTQNLLLSSTPFLSLNLSYSPFSSSPLFFSHLLSSPLLTSFPYLLSLSPPLISPFLASSPLLTSFPCLLSYTTSLYEYDIKDQLLVSSDGGKHCIVGSVGGGVVVNFPVSGNRRSPVHCGKAVGGLSPIFCLLPLIPAEGSPAAKTLPLIFFYFSRCKMGLKSHCRTPDSSSSSSSFSSSSLCGDSLSVQLYFTCQMGEIEVPPPPPSLPRPPHHFPLLWSCS